MRIVALTSGTRGDVQPFVALGVGLKNAGHEVCVAGPENFASFTSSYGLDFHPIQGDTATFLNRDEITNQMRAKNPLSFFLSFREMNRAFRAELDELQVKAWNACQTAEAILYHPGMMNGHYISRELDVPGIMVSPIPFSPTSTVPSLLFYDGPRLGGLYNRMTHTVFSSVFWGSLRPSIADFWEKKQAKRLSIKNPLRFIHREGLPVLYAFSRHVIPPPADWGAHIAVTGYMFPEREPNWSPPEELEAFLNSGSPPVYVGFGSIQGNNAEETLQLAVEALRALGHRIVLAGNSSDETWRDDSEIFTLREAPHTWLFPRMAAVVHHGGAGTTAAGLRAGCPSVIVPHTNDQPMWARRVSELGVGASMKIKNVMRLSAGDFVRVFSKALSPDVRERSGELGRLIRAEDGVERAVACINRYLMDPQTGKSFNQPLIETQDL